MTNSILIALIFFVTNMVAQNDVKLILNEDVVLTSGLKIKLIQEGKGVKAKKGDKVKVHYTGTLVDGLKFDSSIDRNQPFEFILGMRQVIAGWDEGFSHLRQGDKAKLTIPPALGYGDQRNGAIPPGAVLVFDVELIEIIKDVLPKPFPIKEKAILATPSGLKYGLLNKGAGARAEKGKNVTVHYTGFLENGDVFDSSVLRNQPIEFKLGVGQVIPGWDEGIALLKEGDKAKFIIPYQLAYGEEGRPPMIPAKSVLIFNVELISVK
jgi:peptidylprolyl isomerase